MSAPDVIIWGVVFWKTVLLVSPRHKIRKNLGSY
jgi:hypothetical protein